MKIKYPQIVSFVFSSFFLLTLLSQLCNLINLNLRVPQLMSITFFLSGLYCAKKIKFHGFDILILIYLIYLFFNGVLIDYEHHGEFLYRALIYHVSPLMCYFVGRYINVDIKKFLGKMKWPILFAMICGIVLYFTKPSWYVVMKESQLTKEAGDMAVAEIYRLSSFWGHPYTICYATFLYCIYETYLIIKGFCRKKELLLHLLILSICLIVLMLGQLRVTIFVFFLCLVYMILYIKKTTVKKIKLIFNFIIVFSVFGIFFVRIASDKLDYITTHMKNFTEEENLRNRFEHTAGSVKSYSLCGEGLGHYGYPARKYRKWAIVDNQYQCHLAELGYIGLILLLLVLFFTLRRCMTHKYWVVENSIFVFFCIAMFGASVLSNHHQYNYIFWYVVGCLWTLKYKRHYLHEIQSSCKK